MPDNAALHQPLRQSMPPQSVKVLNHHAPCGIKINLLVELHLYAVLAFKKSHVRLLL